MRAYTASDLTRTRLIRDETDSLRFDPKFNGLGLGVRRVEAVIRVDSALNQPQGKKP